MDSSKMVSLYEWPSRCKKISNCEIYFNAEVPVNIVKTK